MIETSAVSIFYGYVLAACMMLVGALAELVWGVEAERRSLESIAMPLSAQKMSDLPPTTAA